MACPLSCASGGRAIGFNFFFGRSDKKRIFATFPPAYAQTPCTYFLYFYKASIHQKASMLLTV